MNISAYIFTESSSTTCAVRFTYDFRYRVFNFLYILIYPSFVEWCSNDKHTKIARRWRWTKLYWNQQSLPCHHLPIHTNPIKFCFHETKTVATFRKGVRAVQMVGRASTYNLLYSLTLSLSLSISLYPVSVSTTTLLLLPISIQNIHFITWNQKPRNPTWFSIGNQNCTIPSAPKDSLANQEKAW